MQEATGEIAELIRRAKEYDRAAFAEIYRQTITPLYRYLAARVNTVEEAEELTQEVFLAALTSIVGIRATDEAGLLAWLFQIGRYKLADHLRRRYRRPVAPIDEAADFADPAPRPDDLAAAAGDRAEVRAALELLTPDQREVIVCKYILGYDNQQTAVVVGKNSNAVNQLHHRALASLGRLLGRKEQTG